MFIESLVQEVHLLGDEDQLMEPNDPVEQGEEVLGVVQSVTSKKLYHLAQVYRKNAALHFVESHFSTSSNSVEQTAATNLKFKAELILDIFWNELREEFPTCPGNIGVREGWQFVGRKNAPPPGGIIGKLIFGEDSPF